ncbi:Uncharacterized protein pbN1_22060 [Aromatoleum bremense]|nr:Uncharacterized protein pbN1_22060 [Aromatoleum bremense]
MTASLPPFVEDGLCNATSYGRRPASAENDTRIGRPAKEAFTR